MVLSLCEDQTAKDAKEAQRAQSCFFKKVILIFATFALVGLIRQSLRSLRLPNRNLENIIPRQFLSLRVIRCFLFKIEIRNRSTAAKDAKEAQRAQSCFFKKVILIFAAFALVGLIKQSLWSLRLNHRSKKTPRSIHPGCAQQRRTSEELPG
jgi:hypothetical protein